MQLTQRTGAERCVLRAVVVALAAAPLVALPGAAGAQVAEVDTTHSVFYEAPTRTHMFVYTPSGDLTVSPWPWLDVSGGWEADVVSGASVSTKAGGVYQASHAADVVSTASVHDLRNMVRGEATVKGEMTSLTAGYAYSTENDYRSSSIHANARTDALQHNTQFELSFAHNWDGVCNRVQDAGATSATLFVALENSHGCFTADPTRVTDAIGIDTFETSWGQSWTPIFETQLTYTAQLIQGFQSDPYRSVILGEGIKAQENVPDERAREALTARMAVYLRGLRAALRLSARGYYDTWAIRSGTLEGEFEKSFGESLRVMARGRLYSQTGAVFWSDDYTGGAPPLGPRGQYFTGDRELSPFWSWLGGLRAIWTIRPAQGRILGFIDSLKLGLSGSVTGFTYLQYTLGGVPISDARAYVGTLSLNVAF